jgi:hypothetical protein
MIDIIVVADNEEHVVEIKPSYFIWEVMLIVQSKTYINLATRPLLYQGVALKKEMTASYYYLVHGAKLFIGD